MADQDFNIRVVTTADTSGIRQTTAGLTEIQKQQQQAAIAAERFGYELGRSIRVLAGGAAIAGGYKFVADLREAANHIEKISLELDKQGAQLVENARHLSEAAKFATTQADVLKIGEGSLKGIEAAHKRLLDTAGKELTLWQKIQDIWAAGFRVTGPQAAALELEKAQAAQNLEMARTAAIQEITAAKMIEARRAGQSYQETLKEITDRIKEQQALADTHWQNKDIQSYLTAAEAVEKYKQQLIDVVQGHQRVEQAVTKSSGQVQAIVNNERAAAQARAEGREKDAEMFEKSAAAFKKAATPEQLEEAKRLETALGVPKAPRTVEQWRDQQQKATDDYYKNQQKATDDYYKRQEEAWREYRGEPTPYAGAGAKDMSTTNQLLRQILDQFR